MNKPQLSAEMEKRLENWWMDNDPLDFGQLSAFLATALEEQRKEILSEVYDLMNESDGVAGLHLNGEVATWDWLLDHGWLPTVAKLNQLKEEE